MKLWSSEYSMSKSLSVFYQPKSFYMIFSLEFWERFGYYGVQAILAVYFVRQLGFSEAKADIVFGSFSALVFGLIVIGGKIGDVYLGTKRTMMLGAFTLAAGYFILGLAASNHFLFFAGLSTVAVGNGLFKANPSNLLSYCYSSDDPQIDSAFTMYYMSINLGSMFSMFIVPYLAAKFNWSIGFYVCTFGLIMCIFSFTLMKSTVKHIGSKPDLQPFNLKKMLICIVGTLVSIFICSWLLVNLKIAHLLLYTIGVIVLVFYIMETLQLKERIERVKMWVSLILIFEAFIFFILYSQMPTSLNFFAIHNVRHTLLGIPIAPEAFQALNPIWIVIASPVLAATYNHFGNKDRDLSMPTKFALGMVLCACAFLILPLAAQTADEKGIISSNWLILSYGLQSIGELLVSGLGLSMIARMVPKKLSGFLMGAWFLSSSFAAMVAGYLASFTATSEKIVNSVQTLPVYSSVFMKIGIFTGIIAIIMLLTAPLLARIIKPAPNIIS